MTKGAQNTQDIKVGDIVRVVNCKYYDDSDCVNENYDCSHILLRVTKIKEVKTMFNVEPVKFTNNLWCNLLSIDEIEKVYDVQDDLSIFI